ncbi:Polynucleotide 5'-hydroxyl-kinase grc3 [Tulasnella sp. 331]|nr:Polynucleotide 5'-hydroxyl-kinase grc3 [Tulasnella sp. 331]
MLSAVAARKAQQQQPLNGSPTKRGGRPKPSKAPVKPGESSTPPSYISTSASPETTAVDPQLKRKRRNHEPKTIEMTKQSTMRNGASIPETAVAGISEPPHAAKKPRRAWSPSQPMVQSRCREDSDGEVENSGGDDDLLVMNLESFTAAGTSDLSCLASSLSSFEPKLGANVFPSSIDGGVVIILAPEDTLCITGTVSLTVLHGSVDLLGTRLTKSPRAHPIFAPRSAPLPIISCSTSAAISAPISPSESLPPKVFYFLDEKNCALLLRPLTTGVEGLEKVCGTFDGVFDGADDTDEVLSICGFHPVYSAANNLQPFTFTPEWKRALDEVAPPTSDSLSHTSTAIPRPLVAMVKGPKRTGKSTFARTLLNRLCCWYRQVAFLDCDLGQSEFSPGGMVSLHVVSHPVFGPPFTHLQRPYMAHYIGSITPRSAPSQYIASIAALLQTYRLDLQCAATELDYMELDDEEGHNARRSDLIPLVVNTQGWTKGLGADLMRALEEIIQPTHLFELGDDGTPPSRGNTPFVQPLSRDHRRASASINDAPGMTRWADQSSIMSTAFSGERHATKVYTLPSMSPGPLANFFTPADTRAIGLMSYFHHTHATSQTTGWQTDVSLLATAPYAVDVNMAFDAILLTGPGSEDVVHEEVLRALNCAVVALVEDENSKDTFGDHESSGNRLPYVQGTPPPDPMTSRCHGLAFIRGISTLSHPTSSSSEPAASVSFQLLTPVPPEVFSRCRILVKGEMEMPIWAFIGSSSDMDRGVEWKGSGKKGESGGGTVSGVPWEKVPYLAFRGVRESTSIVVTPTRGVSGVVGSGVKKARKNVMRRGQI